MNSDQVIETVVDYSSITNRLDFIILLLSILIGFMVVLMFWKGFLNRGH